MILLCLNPLHRSPALTPSEHINYFIVYMKDNHDSWGFETYVAGKKNGSGINLYFITLHLCAILTIRLLFMALVTHITAAIWSLIRLERKLRLKLIYSQFTFISCINLTNIFREHRTISYPHMPHKLFVCVMLACACWRYNKICITRKPWKKELIVFYMVWKSTHTNLHRCGFVLLTAACVWLY